MQTDVHGAVLVACATPGVLNEAGQRAARALVELGQGAEGHEHFLILQKHLQEEAACEARQRAAPVCHTCSGREGVFRRADNFNRHGAGEVWGALWHQHHARKQLWL